MKAYMALSCKAGSYSKVLDKLLDLNLSKRDIFLLFGRVDILVQFRELKSLNEFIEKWFNPVRMTTAEGLLVEKTLTLIVISQGPDYVEEPFAFIFLNTQPINLEKVQQALLKFPQVLSADTVFGPYDVICAVRAKDASDLEKFVSKIQTEIPGIQGSMTTIVSSLY
jgi:DNA-binding Lrp family transcriptional regulator